ncbi:MAG: SDR family NAD(P)-dependent oxidoreductase [Meiothermus sp.]|nr:SDR family NAD(P)-dependent oxidoreductase [Meiothermus sp.]
MKIANSLIVISGASSGIGQASAVELAALGARVILVARSAGKLEATAGHIRKAGGQAWAFPADLSRPQEAVRLAEEVLGQHGVPQALIHSAGAGEWRFLDETPIEDIQRLMDTPFFAAAYLTRAFLPAMLRENRGYILSVCSPASRQVWPGATGYIASRWALNGLTEALRADLYGTGLKAGCMFPAKISDSAYFQTNTETEDRIPTIGRVIPPITSRQAALGVVRCLEQERRILIQPWQMAVFDAFARMFPRVSEYFAFSTGARRPNV